MPALGEFGVVKETAVDAVYAAREHLPPKLRAFVDLLAERFGPALLGSVLSRLHSRSRLDSARVAVLRYPAKSKQLSTAV